MSDNTLCYPSTVTLPLADIRAVALALRTVPRAFGDGCWSTGTESASSLGFQK